MPLEIGPATDVDAAVLAAIGEPSWRDGHLGNVPDELVRIRTSDEIEVPCLRYVRELDGVRS